MPFLNSSEKSRMVMAGISERNRMTLSRPEKSGRITFSMTVRSRPIPGFIAICMDICV